MLLAFGQKYVHVEYNPSGQKTAHLLKASWAVPWLMASSNFAARSLPRAPSPGEARSLTNTHFIDFRLVLLPREADTWQICKVMPISCGSSAPRSVSGKAGAAPRGSLWWVKLKSGRAGGLPWSWWCKSAPRPAAPCVGGSREERKAPCLKSLAPGTAVS